METGIWRSNKWDEDAQRNNKWLIEREMNWKETWKVEAERVRLFFMATIKDPPFIPLLFLRCVHQTTLIMNSTLQFPTEKVGFHPKKLQKKKVIVYMKTVYSYFLLIIKIVYT